MAQETVEESDKEYEGRRMRLALSALVFLTILTVISIILFIRMLR